MDFFKACHRPTKDGLEVYPDFVVDRVKDLMVRGHAFYAVWNEDTKLWSRDEYDVVHIVDRALTEYAKELQGMTDRPVSIKYMRSSESNSWQRFQKNIRVLSDNSHDLDDVLTFANTDTKKTDYVSRRLPYSLIPGDVSAWDELVSTLYSPEEREKLEWAIGSIVAGDAKKLQKFLVLYGAAGTGKSTILNIIEKLFEGYTTTFEAKALGNYNNQFATEAFRSNPLVAIQHDGDLSRIEDNTKLNSIIAHEDMVINEKFKQTYTSRIKAFLFMGTNQPVKISDAKSGLIRRLIDVSPTGNKIPPKHYHVLMSQIDFELGAIAAYCLDVYRRLGKNYYNDYKPFEMMYQTDIFFNFIEATYDVFKSQECITLRQAYVLYKEYCADTGIEKPLTMVKFRHELMNYFSEFHVRKTINGIPYASVYLGFHANLFKTVDEEDQTFSLVIDETQSYLDSLYEDQPAQYANAKGNPSKSWNSVKTTLSEIDTSMLHYVKIPESHIVIDFDLKGPDGEKSLELNLTEASSWPPTYAELSQGGSGVHLHYIYSGDVEQLASVYSEGIEVKTLLGNASLRRRLTKCNNVPMATLNGGLPIKEKKVQSVQTMQSEKGLRELIERNLRKEIHPGTKSSIDFILKILDDAYESGMTYDVTDLRPRIVAFANNSSNQALLALKTVQRMKFKSDDIVTENGESLNVGEPRIAFYDVEVYPNLFVVCWKYEDDETLTKMINPTPQEVEQLFKLRLVGFNNRRYDNHILYARYMGYDNERLYNLSQKIIEGNIGAMFGEAYNLSYTDIYDFSSKKQGLKKFQIDLGLHHQEMDFPWNEPVPEEHWDKVVDYCVNDVVTTEAVFKARKQDFVARQILAELSGLTVNDTTQKHTAKIIFGNDRTPQKSFVYTDLSKQFPGYVYDAGTSTYRGEVTGEGGYVYAEPGIYENVAVLDVASMHPTSIEELNLFGDYTPNFSALKSARLAIKHKAYAEARKMLGGKLAPYLQNPEDAEALSYALKIVINIVYGLTSAKFDNAFRDPRNVDNIVAKRGALFMIDLKHAVQEKGYRVVHIKTDSIKIPNATDEIIQFVKDFGAKYGYEFEFEGMYDKFCLVNDAVYIAKKIIPATLDGDNKDAWKIKWDAVGAQFQHPFVYKTLFTHEDITFEDLCEVKGVVKGAMYIDYEYDRPMFLLDQLTFIGRTGRFLPVVAEAGGGVLYRVVDGKHYAVTGTKGYLWLEASVGEGRKDDLDNWLDATYYEDLVNNAKNAISQFGSFEEFVS